jgi:hypothetical protein
MAGASAFVLEMRAVLLALPGLPGLLGRGKEEPLKNRKRRRTTNS